ncbi:uncharacterized protein FSUBG_9446 [Fusarium subglutinans]|uniref:Uncharacterized protein n=1 Tax=Gibberella subglutinans TaxID=42677 RepID=A0A8H5PCZ4_GIBSU|nr:uncharacterized protein FSUBG_9446 [Fusarium subglutinans]KAF5594344.1 hypothetical protein FSUBG_9446 [Fusarium subglutinans]
MSCGGCLRLGQCVVDLEDEAKFGMARKWVYPVSLIRHSRSLEPSLFNLLSTPRSPTSLRVLACSYGHIPSLFEATRPLVAVFGCAYPSCLECELDIDNDWKPLSEKDVELLDGLNHHQRCDWKGDHACKSDKFVFGLRQEINSAVARIIEATEDQQVAASPMPTATETSADGKRKTHDLAIENLRVQIDISNSLRGLFEVQHRRQAHREAAAGNASALAHIDANNYPPIPPRVGPSTLPRSIGLLGLIDSDDEEEPSDNSESAKSAGKKRAAPGGSGQSATGGKRPRAK